MSSRWLGVAIACALAACGDNSDQCGPGTMNIANECVPTATCGVGTVVDAMTGLCVPDPTLCGAGTIFDPTTGMCEIDPNSCKDGTVLIDGACQDPTAALVVDVEEAPEPNGYGTIEASDAPAGIVTALKPVGGSGVVIHGHLAPFRDTNGDRLLDADADTYLVVVTAPTLVRITGIGLHGVAAAFDIQGAGRGGVAYRRIGLSLLTTSSKRTLYLPAAGTYELTIADSRSIDALLSGGTESMPADGEYFVTIDQLPVPAPTTLAVTAGHATETATLPADGTLFYTLAMGTGLDYVSLTVPSVQVDGAIVAMRGSALGNLASETGSPATMFVAGYDGVQPPLLVVEPTIAYTSQAVPFTLDVLTSDASPLPTDGSASVPIVERRTTTAVSVADRLATSQFYFDAPAAQAVAIDLAWTHPVSGEIYDDQVVSIAQFTSSWTAGTTWSSYHGVVLVPHAGRYYFEVFDPAGVAGVTTLGATSRITPLAATTITLGMPVDAAFDDTFHVGTLAFDAGTTTPWQTFDAVGTNTGGDTLQFFSAGTAARIDALATSSGLAAPVAPRFAHAFPLAGGAFGHILLDEPSTRFLVVARAISAATSQSVHATFAARAIVDLGTVIAGMASGAQNKPIDTTNAPTYVLFHTAVGNSPTITVHPQISASLDTRFQHVAADESAAGPVIDTSANGDDTETFVQAANGWTALIVDAVTPPSSSQAFDVTITAVGP